MTEPLSAAPGYVLGQLARAMETREHHHDAATRERAAKKIERWKQVLEGMLGGSLQVGSRTPIAGTPAWATLEVAHGGFATGNLLASGPLLPHEIDLAARTGVHTGDPGSGDPSRAALNLYFLSDQGRAELAERLHTGCYRVQVPEEGALLVVTWLLANGRPERAQDVLDEILPLAGRLRFYPVPDARPLVASALVKLSAVGQVADALDASRPQEQVARMNEALRVWTPLADRAAALFLETVEGPTPRLRTDERGELVRRPDGHPFIDGGWPCRRYPDGWAGRARSLLRDHEEARRSHSRCGKPEAPNQNFAVLRRYLEVCAKDPAALTGRDVGMIRKVLASMVTKRGAPGSPSHAKLRAEQARVAARPTNVELAKVVSARLRKQPADSGLADLGAVSAPLSPAEAAALRVNGGAAVPEAITAKLARCLEAPIEHLVERGVISSSEVLARVLPQITSQVKAAGIADPDLARLHGAIHAAFARRRSLLLLDLQSQVKLDELPWVAAIKGLRKADLGAQEHARQTLEQVATLAIASFPQTILPNKLLQELRSLAQDAGLTLPLVDELAADIFMGELSGKFVQAAQTAARQLEDTLYAKYYAFPVDRVLRIDDVKQHASYGPPTSPRFAELCEELAGTSEPGGRTVARNGKIIEQEQILTTHNLAVLFQALALRHRLRGRLIELAQACLRSICREEQIHVERWHARLARVKNSAYAWRQMIFFLSLSDPGSIEPFLSWANEHLGAQGEGFRRRFSPALRGLEIAARGGDLDAAERAGTARRLLGWTTERHWLLSD